MHSTVNYNGSTSEAFKVSSGVKQGCVLAPTLFGIFFSMLLQYAFMNCREGVFLHTRSDGKLFNIARLRAKTKVTKVLIHEMLFADDAAVVSHTEEGLQQLVSRLSHACKEFGLKINLKKTNVMAQNAGHPPNHCHWRIQLGSCWKLHLPRVHYLEFTLHRRRGQQQNCQGNSGRLNHSV